MTTKRGSLVHKVHGIAFHRNGISGAPFYVVSFDGQSWDGDETASASLVAAVFQAKGHVAILSYSDPSGRVNIDEKWRGDNFEAELRAAIASWDEPLDEELDGSGHADPEITGLTCPACGENPSPAELGEHAAAMENLGPEPRS